MPPSGTSSAHPVRSWRRVGRWIAFVLFMVGFSWLFATSGLATARHVQTRPLRGIEQRHLELLKRCYQDQHPDFSQTFSEPLNRWVPHRTDGFVQPLWPWTAAWLFEPNSRDSTLDVLARTGVMRIAMMLSFLWVFGGMCLRHFSFSAALLIVLLTGVFGMLPTLDQFDGTSLHQVLFLLVWPACIYGLQRNSLWVYGVIGIFGALAYLTDESILPTLVAFVMVSSLRAIWGWIIALWPREAGTTLWVRRNHVFGLLLVATMFGFIAGPRLAESRQIFGSAFFSKWSETRWLDDAEEVDQLIARPSSFASAEGPERPNRAATLANYQQDHPPEAIVDRLLRGLAWVRDQVSGAAGPYLLGLTILLLAIWISIAVAAPKAHHAWQRLHPETPAVALFVILTVAGYTVIAAWDAAVMNPRPLILPLQAALVLTLLWACESLLRRARRRGASRWIFIGYRITLWTAVGIGTWQAIQQLRPDLSLP